MSKKDNKKFVLRQASVDDIDKLLVLEARCFDTDRLARRNFHWMIRKAHSALLVAMHEDVLAGYILVLFHAGTSLARIYSIAVSPDYRGHGLADRLLTAAEEASRAADSVYMRLEVRPDNLPAIKLYEKHGYRQFGIYPGFYEDETDALRYEKRILLVPEQLSRDVPHYAQTTGFTCGPAALMMAMQALQPKMPVNADLEFQLWREATTIFMASGHGGCGPQGLALSASKRGFGVRLWINSEQPLFLAGVRDETKKKVLEIVHRNFTAQLKVSPVVVKRRAAGINDLRQELAAGGMPVVLISHYRLSRTKTAHWVVVTAVDDHFVYLHDPEIDVAQHKSVTDSMYVPVRHDSFLKMAKYGQQPLRATVVVYRGSGTAEGLMAPTPGVVDAP